MIRLLLGLSLLAVCFLPSAHAKEWEFIRSGQDDTTSLIVLIKGSARTYYKASNLALTLTGPGYLKIISRWVGPRPTARDTSYTLRVTVGKKQYRKHYRVTRSGVAGIRQRKLWVGKSRTFTIPLPSTTTVVRIDSPLGNVYVRPFFSQQPTRLGKLRSMSPTTFCEVVRLERKERERKYYRATTEKPVELQIIGPTTLVVYSRLEFTYDMKGLQNYGIQIWEEESLLHSFAWSTSRSDVTRYMDRDDLVPSPGQKALVKVPRGAHQWTFKPSSRMESVLFRFLIPERDL